MSAEGVPVACPGPLREPSGAVNSLWRKELEELEELER